MPFVKASASGVAEPPTVAATKAVVANCVELVPGIAVGAVGVPVNEGDAIVARNNMSAVFAVILDVFIAILAVLEVILAVLDKILLDKETVSENFILGKVSVLTMSAKSFVVASVPDVGKTTLLAAVVVIVKSPIPFVNKLLLSEIVLPLLLTPVPPFELGNIELIVKAESAYLALSAVIA